MIATTKRRFLEVVTDVSAGSPKVPQSQYLPLGRYPVIDQGQTPVAGFTDDPQNLSKASLPLVIFGDHTRRFKFVDSPFAVGADGVKLLQTSTELDPKYAFRYFESIELPNVGYSRHFKFLKDLEIPLPPLPEQRRIAEILDRADELRTKRRRALTLIDELADAMFETLISVVGGTSSTVLIRTVADIRTGPFGSLLHREDYVANGVPLVNPMHIQGGRVRANPDYAISDEKFEELSSYELHRGDVVLARRGEMGRAAEVLVTDGRLLCGTGSMILRPKEGKATGAVLARLLATPELRNSLEQSAQGVTMLNLNQSIVGETRIRLPSFDRQVAFGATASSLETLKSAHRAHLVKLDELVDALLHIAFNGKL